MALALQRRAYVKLVGRKFELTTAGGSWLQEMAWASREPQPVAASQPVTGQTVIGCGPHRSQRCFRCHYHGTPLAMKRPMRARRNQHYLSNIKPTLCRGLLLPGLLLFVLLFTFGSQPSHSQIVLRPNPVTLVTIEAYGNLTTGAALESRSQDGPPADAVAFDGAGRVLVRFANPVGPDIGARIVTDVFNDRVRVTEASLLLLGSGGRLEIGKRMGLPDVLTGYAPNSFSFTTAQFGPPTGFTLDPGGGLITHYSRSHLRARLEALASRGVTAFLFDDESSKILYVSPKRNGWLGGASFAPNAEDARFDRLVQLGIVHETYWHQNIWRWGGTYAHARAEHTGDAEASRDLNSVSLGTSVVLDDALEIGVAASYDGKRSGSVDGDPAWGSTFSVNYNTGPWTVGGYYQYARAPGAGIAAGNDRLSAVELGASYRFTTRVRIYGAWLLYDLKNDHNSIESISSTGSLLTLGLRAQL